LQQTSGLLNGIDKIRILEIMRIGMKLEYPIGFPENVVETEKIRADQDFKLTEQTQTLEQRALRWVCRVLGAFAHQACKLGKEERWTLAEVGAAVDEFCLDLVRKANYLLSDGRLGMGGRSSW
jgi:hypothetical protein